MVFRMINESRPASDQARERSVRRVLQAALGAGALAVPMPLAFHQIPPAAPMLRDAPPEAGALHDVQSAGEFYSREVMELVNQQRTANGCPPLAINLAVTSAAYEHSQDMAVNGYFAHDTPSGVTPWTRMQNAGYAQPAAENIAEGYQTPQDVVNGWMNSPSHRQNILNCSYKAAGVGYYDGPSKTAPANGAQNNNGSISPGPWWTQDFGYE
jgi:uncharacterized protein YkwD